MNRRGHKEIGRFRKTTLVPKCSGCNQPISRGSRAVMTTMENAGYEWHEKCWSGDERGTDT